MQIIMPKLGLTMTHGTVTEWLKAPGETVQAEEALCTYETEKVTLELPSPADGVLAEILVAAGETVAAGTALCVVATKDDGPSTKDGGRSSVVSPQSTVVSSQSSVDGRQSSAVGGRPSAVGRQPSAVGGRVHATPKARSLARQLGVDLDLLAGCGPDGRVQAIDVSAAAVVGAGLVPARITAIKATPLARRIAAAEGLDLTAIPGSGPDGTITREDVEAASRRSSVVSRQSSAVERGAEVRGQGPAVGAQPSAVGETIIPLTTLRRVIGERMSQSATSAPHVTLMTEAEATHLVSARAQLNEELAATQQGGKIAFNTLLVALVARALREHPQLNARLGADGIHLLAQINIALAVDTERGLVTPVLREVDGLSLAAIQRGYDALIARAAAGKSLPEDFEGGTFTLTNLGALDVDGFTPIINPPQAAILGVGRIIEKPVARDGAVVVRPMVTLSFSFDHRIVDGAPAARYLQRVKQLVERPMALLV
jgi:pyruvate dehydrogenase E2 component (dihydrolipoamide acetyltransferase)